MTEHLPHNSSQESQESPSQQPEKQSFLGIIVHSFFVIPFLIVVFGVLLFAAVRLLTAESKTPYDYLSDVKTGGLTKRWQSAFELSRVMSGVPSVNSDDTFIDGLMEAFNNAGHDDPRVRQYLALAMGKTKNKKCIEPLVKSLTDENPENLYSIIYALGVIGDPSCAPQIQPFLKHSNSHIRLVAAMTLGNVNNASSIEPLKRALNDDEANVRWDAAIALAKLHDKSGKEILLQLLNRDDLDHFTQLDTQEKAHILLVAIEATKNFNDPDLQKVIKELSAADQNIHVRKAAMDALNNSEKR